MPINGARVHTLFTYILSRNYSRHRRMRWYNRIRRRADSGCIHSISHLTLSAGDIVRQSCISIRGTEHKMQCFPLAHVYSNVVFSIARHKAKIHQTHRCGWITRTQCKAQYKYFIYYKTGLYYYSLLCSLQISRPSLEMYYMTLK